MQAYQTQHIRDVLAHVYGSTRRPAAAFEPKIIESWQRCVHQHGLNPEVLQEALILPQHNLAEHVDAMDGLNAGPPRLAGAGQANPRHGLCGAAGRCPRRGGGIFWR